MIHTAGVKPRPRSHRERSSHNVEIPKIPIRDIQVSRFIIGGNPFSGFSHRGVDCDREMVAYFTVDRIKKTLRQAEDLGIDTFLGRADQHIIRMLLEYRSEGGAIQWFAQTCPEMTSIERSLDDAIAGGAAAAYVHGGVMDNLLATGRLDQVPPAVEKIRKAGLPAGVAGHDPRVFEWAEANLDLDFYMCSYYNSAHRDENAEHIHGRPEWFLPEDRDRMAAVIGTLSKPTIHYKVLAAGRNDPAEAFDFVARHIRPQDAVCVGVYMKDRPDMLAEDVRLFLEKTAG